MQIPSVRVINFSFNAVCVTTTEFAFLVRWLRLAHFLVEGENKMTEEDKKEIQELEKQIEALKKKGVVNGDQLAYEKELDWLILWKRILEIR